MSMRSNRRQKELIKSEEALFERWQKIADLERQERKQKEKKWREECESSLV